AHTEEDARPAIDHRPQGGDHVVSVGRRWLEAEALTQTVEELPGRHLGNANRAIALDVRMATHWADAGAFAPDIALEQAQVGELLHVTGAVAVLRQAHAINH